MRFMTYETARILSQITSDFYARVSSSFSDTRQAPWEGWKCVAEETRDVCVPGMRVLDLGCGNLRFERFLASCIGRENAPAKLNAWAYDNCPSLVEAGGTMPPGACVRFRALDIAGTLFDAEEGHAARNAGDGSKDADDSSGTVANRGEGATPDSTADSKSPAADSTAESKNPAPDSTAGGENPAPGGKDDGKKSAANGASAIHAHVPAQALCRAIDAPACDLSAAFGLMHHLALLEHRLAVLEALATHTRPGGYVVASFWQFANSEKLLAKACAATEEGCAALDLPPLGPNDYLLGWQHEQSVYRFCHHFPESEIDELAHALEPRAREIARFSADGKTHNLNRYVVLQVR